ncbi:uncharacterized protein LOC120109519 [Phoenix dactylifera]|uniref:Uncharacterized protein LOC120109519 n=1 Tax=Phoenix dactylifera TaxID=42345 RepID=A0A8B9A7M5_PHODC|nr:uncharacterized protein LOC120109519 [Phoenix dactylifera]
MKVLLWNCRGAGKPSFRPAFRRLVSLHDPDVCVLLETRLSGSSLERARRAIPRSWGTYAVDSWGLSGGIIVLWRLGGVGIDVFHKCNQQVILVISEGAGPPWVILATYASTNHRERRVLWEEATSLIQLGHPVMMAGDFNCIDSPKDKRGGKVFSNNIEVREFQDFIQSNGLADLGFTGPHFTWCNNRLGMARVWERIDRVYAMPGWLQRFPDFLVRHLPRIASDHCPVLVSTPYTFPVHCPFRFEKVWLSYPRSWEVVREAWQMPVRGDVMYRVTRKLEQPDADCNGGIRRRLGISSGGWRRRRHPLPGGVLEAKVQIQWIREGDRNTRFFHQSTIIRRHRNRIGRIRDSSGRVSEDQETVRRILVQFFRDRWTESGGTDGGACGSVPGRQVSVEENAALVSPVSGDEVQAALWSLGEDRAPGPDGFPPIFFRRYWHIVKQEVTATVQQFFVSTAMPVEWRRTFITLIPKRQDLVEPSHYKPISLCTPLYKVVARVLVQRMRGILPRLICPEQGAFIEGRSISDNVLIAHEFMADL